MFPSFLNDRTERVFTLVTRGRFLTSASKFNVEPNGKIFDVSPENDHASLNVKTPEAKLDHNHQSSLGNSNAAGGGGVNAGGGDRTSLKQMKEPPGSGL